MQSSIQLKPLNSLPTLRRGNTGENVEYLQRLLNQERFFLVVDGIFGERTEAAVKQFQTNHHLLVDGIVGSQTWGALYFDLID
jgi:peptidoglycan hydrolase-like protein with peptidoglycan-binding domain